MNEAHIGRLMTASLHQAIADELPQRLEFYENWLHSGGLRGGTMGEAPMMAVLGFLRTEGDGYERVVARAGALAAEWALVSVSLARHRLFRFLPRPLRVRGALRIAAGIASAADAHSRYVAKARRGSVRVHVAASLFCSVRGVQASPLCGFYRALTLTTLAHFGLVASAAVEQCRAMGDGACVIAVHLDAVEPAEETAEAA